MKTYACLSIIVLMFMVGGPFSITFSYNAYRKVGYPSGFSPFRSRTRNIPQSMSFFGTTQLAANDMCHLTFCQAWAEVCTMKTRHFAQGICGKPACA